MRLFFLIIFIFTSVQINAEPMTFITKYMNASTLIYANGDIVEDTPEKLQEAIDQLEDGIPYIIFNSNGGDLIAGLQMGYIIRKNYYGTEIGLLDDNNSASGVCLSSCALAFMGGDSREHYCPVVFTAKSTA